MRIIRLRGGALRWILRIGHVIESQNFAALEEREKRDFLLSLAQRHSLTTFIETGTYLGATTKFMAQHKYRCITIEIDEQLYAQATRRLSSFTNVQLLQGDSAEQLSRVLSTLQEPALFWLDAHYSGGITGKGEKGSPILQELEQIFGHSVDRHVIAIDDARHFLGLDGYPSLRRLRRMVAERSQYSVRLRDDILWLYREGI